MEQSYIDHLEKMGVKGVNEEIAKGKHGQNGSRLRDQVEAWIRTKEIAQDQNQAELVNKRDKRALEIAEEALKISKEDLKIAVYNSEEAKKQARWAMWSALIAVTAAIASNSQLIIALF
jgi:hypothetical protein